MFCMTEFVCSTTRLNVLGIRYISQTSERRHYGPTDGPTDGSTDGQTDGQTLLYRCKDASNKFGHAKLKIRSTETAVSFISVAQFRVCAFVCVCLCGSSRCCLSSRHGHLGYFSDTTLKFFCDFEIVSFLLRAVACPRHHGAVYRCVLASL